MRIVSILFAFVLAVSLVLVPAVVQAADGDELGGLQNCKQEPLPKWYDNEPSYYLYLMNWGRTPIQAMSRLRGLCGTKAMCAEVGTPTSCPGKDCGATAGCPACRQVEQGATATCDDPAACQDSLSGTACKVTPQKEPTCPEDSVIENFLPTCCCCWGVSLAFANKSWGAADIGTHPRLNNEHLNHFGVSECYGGNKGGDWGVTAAPHTECCALTWALQDNCFARPYGDKCAPN
ncbi:MAG: hypothetical protein FJ023_07070 [Chloroflexi bacterium]|nr:hypothetical protein [Chloroflexota bacterium]